jgi:hypothetical protein
MLIRLGIAGFLGVFGDWLFYGKIPRKIARNKSSKIARKSQVKLLEKVK